MAETGKALERIVAQVAEINATLIEMAASAHEQSMALHEVNTAASHSLSRETEQLARLIGRFQTGTEQPAAALARNTRMSRAA